jgi:hypothetical protein
VVLYIVTPHLVSSESTMSSDDSPKTLSVPEAGRRYFSLSRNAAYDAARRGDIPTIRIGRLLRVPVRACERILDEAATHLTKAKDSAELTGEAE